MTSQWDYSIQRYKENRDVFLEPGLVSIVFLACGRPTTTRNAFLSTLDCATIHNQALEWIFIENGKSQDNMKFFEGFSTPRKVIIKQDNFGINQGLNQGLAISRGEIVMIHENDWECRRAIDFFQIGKDIMEEKPDVGIIQLRAPFDPCENWGLHKPEYNPWTCSEQALENANIKIWKEKTKTGHDYFISRFPNGFNNNPILMRKSLYRECGPYPEPELGCDPRHGETEYQARVAKTDCAIAHIGIPLYFHCGQQTTPRSE